MYSRKQKNAHPSRNAPKKAFSGLLEKTPDVHAKHKPAIAQTNVNAIAQAQVAKKKGAFGWLRSRLPEIHAYASAVITLTLFIYAVAANPITHYAVAKIFGPSSMQMSGQTSAESSVSGAFAMEKDPGPTTKPSKDKKKKDPGENTTMS